MWCAMLEAYRIAFDNQSRHQRKRDAPCGGIESSIVNRLSHSSVTDASGAHLCFKWRRAGSVPQMPHLPYGITLYYLLPDANPSLPYIWEKGQTSACYCRNLPGSEADTNLNCLANRGTCVWTTCPRSLPGSALAQSQTFNLAVTRLAYYS